MRKLKRAIKRSSGVVLASAMILNSSGVMTFANTLELENTITSIEQNYGINSSKNTISNTIEETQEEHTTQQVEAGKLTEQSVEQLSEEVSEQDIETQDEAAAQEELSDNVAVEAPESVTASADTGIGDRLRTLLDNGTALTGKVVDDEYQITVKKGQNIGFYSNSTDYNVKISDGEFEYAEYNVTSNVSFGTNWNTDAEKGNYLVVTALNDGIINIPSELKDSVEIKSVTSQALKHHTVEAGKSYEFKLADDWENTVDIDSNQRDDWFEYANYNADGINSEFGVDKWYLGRLSKEDKTVRKVITSTYKSDVDVIYPYEYDVTAITFAESTTPALKHNTVEAGKSYELKLADGWENTVDIDSNQRDDWFEYANYNADGINSEFGVDKWYLGRLSKEDKTVRKVITSTYKSDVDVTYPYEYDTKAVTFTETKTPALKHQIIEAGKSYQIELKEGQTITPTFNSDNLDMEYAVYGNDGYCYDYSEKGRGLYNKIDAEKGRTKLVFTSKSTTNTEVTYPYEYDVTVMTFAESETPALQRKTIQAGKNYELKLVGEKINDFVLKGVNNVEYAIYGNDGECNSYGNNNFSSYEFNKKLKKNRLVLTSTSDSDSTITIPSQYVDDVITFNETDKKAIERITLSANKNYKLTNNGQYKVSPQYSSNLLIDVISGNNYEVFQSTTMPDIPNSGSVYVSTYTEDNTITVPTEYGENLKLEEVDEPIFNRIELKAGETVKLTSKAGLSGTAINMSGDYSSKISTLVMNPNQSGKLSSDMSLSPLTLYGSQEMYIQASSANATNVLLGVSYKSIKNGDVTVEKKDKDISEVNKFENVTKVAVKEAKAVKPDEKKVTYTTALSDYKYTMFNETTKEYIYGYKYNTSGELTFSNGSVNDGDVISITLSSDKIDTVTQKFTYKKNGNVELNVAQKGGYSITGSGDLYTNAYLLDSEGKVVKSDVTKADINEANISGGKYQLLVVRTNEQYVNTLTSLSDLNLYGLEKDKDYTLTNCEIKSGVISTFDVSKRVSLRNGKTLTSFDKTKTKVTASSATLIGDNKETITVNYALSNKFNDWSLNRINITIPSYVTVVQDSVKVNGENVKYTYNYGQLAVNTTNKTGKVTFEVQGTNSGSTTTNTRTFTVSANLTPAGSSSTVTNTLGEASIKQYNFNLSTSGIISKNEAQLTGSNTVPGQEVAIFVDGKKVTTVKTDSNGAWNTKVALPKKKVGESYKIYASLYTGTKNEVKTAEKKVTYNPISSTVKQFNLLYNSQSYNIVYYNSVGSKPNLKAGSSYKFTLGFGSTNVKDVYVIGIKDGVQKKIKATKDANGNWVAEGYFDNDKTFVPDAYNVTFTEEAVKPLTINATKKEADKTVTFTANGNGGRGKYTYKFLVYNKTTNSWAKLQDFSSKNTFTWTKGNAGDRYFYVDVKDNSTGKVVRSKALNVKIEEATKSLKISATKKEADKTVTFTANGSGGSGKYTYKFLVYNKTTNSWAKLQDFSSKNTFTWTKGNAGDRYFYVDVKDNTTGKTVRSEALNVKINATSSPTSTLTASTANVNVGGKVTLTAKATAGSGKYTYKFLIYNPATKQWAKLQDFSSKSTFTWSAGSAGVRQFYVDVKDSNGKVTRSKVVNVNIGKIQSVTKLSVKATASTTANKIGQNVTFAATANGGAGGYTYKFLVYNKATKQWGKLQDFSATSKLTWKAGSAGEREFYVDVKDKNGNTVRSSVMNVKTTK